MSAAELINTGREYSDDELRKRLSGHLCRCTGYENIFKAVRKMIAKGPPAQGETITQH
jgi:carbon-monoxide dehydrogenase small subunit